MFANEQAWRSPEKIRAGLREIWSAMQSCECEPVYRTPPSGWTAWVAPKHELRHLRVPSALAAKVPSKQPPPVPSTPK